MRGRCRGLGVIENAGQASEAVACWRLEPPDNGEFQGGLLVGLADMLGFGVASGSGGPVNERSAGIEDS